MKKGFTLIETLVAITILMISVVGPLTIASKGLVAAAGSRDQVTASYLAQDVMESIKNIRDGDLLVNSSTGWNTFMGTYSSCTRTAPCGLETAPDWITNDPDSTSCAVNNYRLYKASITINNAIYSYYTCNNLVDNIATQFYRSFYLTDLSSGGTDPASALLTVNVSWKEGNAPSSQVVLNSVLFNTTR